MQLIDYARCSAISELQPTLQERRRSLLMLDYYFRRLAEQLVAVRIVEHDSASAVPELRAASSGTGRRTARRRTHSMWAQCPARARPLRWPMGIDLLQKSIVLFVSDSARRVVAVARIVKRCESLPSPSEQRSVRTSWSAVRAEQSPAQAYPVEERRRRFAIRVARWTAGRERSLNASCRRANALLVSPARAARRSVRRESPPEGAKR